MLHPRVAVKRSAAKPVLGTLNLDKLLARLTSWDPF